MNMKMIDCPRCGKEGIASVWGNICTDCANYVRLECDDEKEKEKWLINYKRELVKEGGKGILTKEAFHKWLREIFPKRRKSKEEKINDN